MTWLEMSRRMALVISIPTVHQITKSFVILYTAKQTLITHANMQVMIHGNIYQGYILPIQFSWKISAVRKHNPHMTARGTASHRYFISLLRNGSAPKTLDFPSRAARKPRRSILARSLHAPQSPFRVSQTRR